MLREQIRLRDEYNVKAAELQVYMANTTDSLDLQRLKTEELRNRVGEIVARYSEISRLMAQAVKEKQYARKVDLNLAIQYARERLKASLSALIVLK